VEVLQIMIVLEYIAWAIALAGIAIITWGVLRGTVEFITIPFQGRKGFPIKPLSITRIRNQVGQHLLLGLEFLIAADVIRTVIEPGLEEIAILGSIVVIRTVISYFLNKEMDSSS